MMDSSPDPLEPELRRAAKGLNPATRRDRTVKLCGLELRKTPPSGVVAPKLFEAVRDQVKKLGGVSASNQESVERPDVARKRLNRYLLDG